MALDRIPDRTVEDRGVERALDEEIVRSCSQRVGVRLGAGESGQHDQRGGAPALRRCVQQVEPTVLAEVVVDEANVVLTACERLEPAGVGLFPIELEPLARHLLKQRPRQDVVVGIVFDQEDTDRRVSHRRAREGRRSGTSSGPGPA